MSKFEGMSDFELSCAALEKYMPQPNRRPVSAGKCSNSACWDSNYLDTFDINNWADMGPVINEKGILTLKDGESWIACYNYNLSIGWDLSAENGSDFIFDDSQLRAAAICYLEAV